MFPMTTYFNKDAIANILSMTNGSVLYRVTQDTAISDSIFVHIDDDHTVPFKRCSRGLYAFDTASPLLATNTSLDNNHVTFFSTVSENKAFFTRREIEGSDKAR